MRGVGSPREYYGVKFASVSRETFWVSVLYTPFVLPFFLPSLWLRRPLAGGAGRHSPVPCAFSAGKGPPGRPPLRFVRPDVPLPSPPARPPSGSGGPVSPGPPGLGPRPLRVRSVLRFAPSGAPGSPAVASRPPAPPSKFVDDFLAICRFFIILAADNQCFIILSRLTLCSCKKSGFPGKNYQHLQMKIRHLSNSQLLWELFATKWFPRRTQSTNR